MSITNKTWAIIGGAAALVLVPAGVSYAVAAANDDARPAISRPDLARAGQQDQAPAERAGQYGGMRGGMDGGMHGDTARLRDQSGDQDRDRARDGSNCDDDRRVGTPPAGDTRDRGQGMMDGSGPRNS
jgi:hypothetical protein